jgi:hypothetical protein
MNLPSGIADFSLLSGRPAVTISAPGSSLLMALPTTRSMLAYSRGLGRLHQ